ncbi:MAG: hypothetical protein ABSH47_09085 [Bryobacteraceae bacterium]|jgi:uncharacterized protein (DUF3084 family)
MSLKQTADNLSGIDAVNAADKLASIWDGTTATVDAAQLASDLAKADANRKQQISQIEAEIAAEQKQAQANDKAIDAGAAPLAAIDLEVARREGREDEMEAEAAALEKEPGVKR